MTSPADEIYLRIARHNRLLTEGQVQQAIAEQTHLSPDRPIGEILVDRGFLTPAQDRKVLDARERHQGRSSGRTPLETDRSSAQAPGRSGVAGQDSGQRLLRQSNVASIREAAAVASAEALSDDIDGAGVLVGKSVNHYLKFARDVGASDLHLQAGEVPFVRAHGFIHYLNHPPLEIQQVQRLIAECLTPEQRSLFVRTNDLDLCYEHPEIGRFRSNLFRERRGYGAVFRIIPDKVPTIEELNLPPILSRFTTWHQGIVLVTGPGGCGKSSTLAALVEIINRDRKDHIISIEDPIEFRFSSKRANVTQRQVEVHTRSWDVALRAALREDPDVIVIGEMRDLETISTAITAAETGHLVLATLHTTNATRSVDRILDVFPPKEQPQVRAMVSESLRGVVSQCLIPTEDGTGRIPACEIMFVTPAVANLIRERKTFQLPGVIQMGRKQGMCLMDDAIRALYKERKIKKDMAALFAHDPKRFLDL